MKNNFYEKKIFRLSIFVALFFSIIGLITAASVVKCPYCGKNARPLKCPVCGYVVEEHVHVAATGNNEEGETVYYNLVRGECPSCQYVWFVELN